MLCGTFQTVWSNGLEKYEKRLLKMGLMTVQELPVRIFWPSGNNFTSVKKNHSCVESCSCNLIEVCIQGHRASCGWAVITVYAKMHHWEVIGTLNAWTLLKTDPGTIFLLSWKRQHTT